MSTATLSKTLQKFLSEIENQSSKEILKGYYPADAVIDAFTKGEESGAKKAFDDFKDQYVSKVTQIILDGTNLMRDLMKKGHEISGFYLNPSQLCFMITTPIENTYNEAFIDDFYALAQKYEQDFFEQYQSFMRLKFIQDSGLNTEALRIDGFITVANGAA